MRSLLQSWCCDTSTHERDRTGGLVSRTPDLSRRHARGRGWNPVPVRSPQPSRRKLEEGAAERAEELLVALLAEGPREVLGRRGARHERHGFPSLRRTAARAPRFRLMTFRIASVLVGRARRGIPPEPTETRAERRRRKSGTRDAAVRVESEQRELGTRPLKLGASRLCEPAEGSSGSEEVTPGHRACSWTPMRGALSFGDGRIPVVGDQFLISH